MFMWNSFFAQLLDLLDLETLNSSEGDSLNDCPNELAKH